MFSGRGSASNRLSQCSASLYPSTNNWNDPTCHADREDRKRQRESDRERDTDRQAEGHRAIDRDRERRKERQIHRQTDI